MLPTKCKAQAENVKLAYLIFSICFPESNTLLSNKKCGEFQ
jgi:hypothetical protein